MSATAAVAPAVLAGAVPVAVWSALAATGRSRVRGRLGEVAVLALGTGGKRGGGPGHRPRPARPPGLHLLARLASRAGGGRGQARRQAALAPVLTTVVQRLRSGHSLAQALVAAAGSAPEALAPDLAELARRLERGAGLVDTLAWWGGRRPHDDLIRTTASALAVAAATGGPAAGAVEVVIEAVRDRQALAGEVDALTAQARASAAVIGLAPLGMAALAAATDRTTAAYLFTTGPGLAMLAGGLVLDALGLAWMASMLGHHR